MGWTMYLSISKKTDYHLKSVKIYAYDRWIHDVCTRNNIYGNSQFFTLNGTEVVIDFGKISTDNMNKIYRVMSSLGNSPLFMFSDTLSRNLKKIVVLPGKLRYMLLRGRISQKRFFLGHFGQDVHKSFNYYVKPKFCLFIWISVDMSL